MIVDREYIFLLCRMLNGWKAWATDGGIIPEDLGALYDIQENFAQASLVISVLQRAATVHAEASVDA